MSEVVERILGAMPTIQVRLTKNQLLQVEALVKSGVYRDRSDAVRDAVRRLLEKDYDRLVQSHRVKKIKL